MKMEITDEQLIGLLEESNTTEIERLIKQEESIRTRVDELKEVLRIMNDVTEVEVPARIKQSFTEAIVSYRTRGSQLSVLQVAAAIAFLVVGFALGMWSQSGNTSEEELVALRAEIQSLRKATLTSTLQWHSASERIMAVNRIEQEPSINEELVNTLVSTLNADESPSVRYAALQALGKFINNESVRAELVSSLKTQSDPLVQISLINMLLEAEEHSAVAPLKDILEQEGTLPEVKQQAEVALQVLT